MADGLVAFLQARYDEDDQAARDAGGKSWEWEQHYGDMCNDPTCEYGNLATDDTILMSVHAYNITVPWQGAEHIARHNPARVLAEVDAKRQLLRDAVSAKHAVCEDPWYTCPAATEARDGGECGKDDMRGEPCECGRDDRLHRACRLLALPYADHPDYREEWRP
jgi:hypothetical protein